MNSQVILSNLRRAIKEKDYSHAKKLITELPLQDIADVLKDLDPKESAIFFRLLPTKKAANLFSEINPELQRQIIYELEDKHVQNIISNMAHDDRTLLLDELPGNVSLQLLKLLPKKQKRLALEHLGYPKESIGRLATPDYVSVNEQWKVKDAIEYIRKVGKDSESFDIVYVLDNSGKLVDEIPLRKLILAEPDKKVDSLLDRRFVSIHALEDREKAARMMAKYDLTVLPVTDREGYMLGIVTVDDLIDVLEIETTEDFHKTSAVAPLETSYSSSSVLSLYRKRAIWLVLFLFAELVSSGVIAYFNESLQAAIAIAFFIPVLIATGGNTAIQAATLVIRAISTGDLGLTNWAKSFSREILVGLLLGITLAVLLYFQGLFISNSAQIGFVLALSMLATIIWANVLGSLLPIVITKVNLDPAVVSSPFLTTIVDATGLIIYFLIARAILGI